MNDLFSTPEQQPKEVRKIVKRYEKKHFDLSYDECRSLVSELEKVGYTCDYGLDAIPVDLRKIETKTTKTINIMIKVFFEYGNTAEKVATFESEQLYILCLPTLEAEAIKRGAEISESVEHE